MLPGNIFKLPENICCSGYVQEGLAIKAERMKKKIKGGKKKVEIDEIKVKIHLVWSLPGGLSLRDKDR